MTREEFQALADASGTVLYPIAYAGKDRASGKLVKIFKDTAVLDFTLVGVYNTVDYRSFRYQQLSAVPVSKKERDGVKLTSFRCVETGKEYETLTKAAAEIGGTVDGISKAIKDRRAYRGFHFEKLTG